VKLTPKAMDRAHKIEPFEQSPAQAPIS
ncbi:uncharacterized protein METZ01_LOCUS497470, partial [marine metagenome]